MNKTVKAVLKLIPPYDADPAATLAELAQYCLDTFGEGGNPGATRVEDFIGRVNTPCFGGYLRVEVTEAYGQALELISASGGLPQVELVRVEWLTDANGNPAVYAPVTYQQERFDMDGNSLGMFDAEIGQIA